MKRFELLLLVAYQYGEGKTNDSRLVDLPTDLEVGRIVKLEEEFPTLLLNEHFANKNYLVCPNNKLREVSENRAIVETYTIKKYEAEPLEQVFKSNKLRSLSNRIVRGLGYPSYYAAFDFEFIHPYKLSDIQKGLYNSEAAFRKKVDTLRANDNVQITVSLREKDSRVHITRKMY